MRQTNVQSVRPGQTIPLLHKLQAHAAPVPMRDKLIRHAAAVIHHARANLPQYSYSVSAIAQVAAATAHPYPRAHGSVRTSSRTDAATACIAPIGDREYAATGEQSYPASRYTPLVAFVKFFQPFNAILSRRMRRKECRQSLH